MWLINVLLKILIFTSFSTFACFSKSQESRESLLAQFQEKVRTKNDKEAVIIMEKLYANNVENVIELMEYFRTNMKTIDQLIRSYKLLYNEMKPRTIYNKGVVKKHLEQYQAILLKGRVEEVIEMKNFQNIAQNSQKEAKKLLNDLNSDTKPLIKMWEKEILKGNCTQIVELSGSNYMALRYVVRDVVKFVFQQNRAIVKKLVMFARSLNYIEQSMVAYKTLYEMMNENDYLRNPQVLMLAQGIKKCMDMPNYDRLLDEDKQTFETLRNDLPKDIVDIVWNDMFCIQNVQTNSYLSARPDGESHYKQRRTIRFSSTCSEWKLETFNMSETYWIKSGEYEEYMFTGRDSFAMDHNKRRIFTMLHSKKPVKDWIGDWYIEPTEDMYIFYIRSVKCNEYLFADESLLPNRAFTFRKKGEKPENALWRITLT